MPLVPVFNEGVDGFKRFNGGLCNGLDFDQLNAEVSLFPAFCSIQS